MCNAIAQTGSNFVGIKEKGYPMTSNIGKWKSKSFDRVGKIN